MEKLSYTLPKTMTIVRIKVRIMMINDVKTALFIFILVGNGPHA